MHRASERAIQLENLYVLDSAGGDVHGVCAPKGIILDVPLYPWSSSERLWFVEGISFIDPHLGREEISLMLN